MPRPGSSGRRSGSRLRCRVSATAATCSTSSAALRRPSSVAPMIASPAGGPPDAASPALPGDISSAFKAQPSVDAKDDRVEGYFPPAVDRSSAAPTGRDRERAERLTKDWIARLIERTPLAEVGGLPLARIAAEAPPLISTAFVALGSGERGPGELAEAAVRLAELFGEAAAPVTVERPVA